MFVIKGSKTPEPIDGLEINIGGKPYIVKNCDCEHTSSNMRWPVGNSCGAHLFDVLRQARCGWLCYNRVDYWLCNAEIINYKSFNLVQHPLDKLASEDFFKANYNLKNINKKYKSKCPICGNLGEDLIFKFYCSNKICKNYHI